MPNGPTAPADAEERARAALEAHPRWYHTIELAPGVSTPGEVDLRALAPRVLPERLDGLRALDVGTFDGFWAFELERRGASVVALDLPGFADSDWPPIHRERLLSEIGALGLELGRGFELAAAALGSRAERRALDVYDLGPDAIGGPVDLVFSGAILLHLRDPVRALERMRAALAPGGRAILLEPVSFPLTLVSPRVPIARFSVLDTNFVWWRPNAAAVAAWAVAAGFDHVRRRGLHRPRSTSQRQIVCAVEARAPGGQGIRGN